MLSSRLRTTRVAFRLVLATALFALTLVSSGLAQAAHFRHGTIAASRPDPAGAPLTWEFVVRTTWNSSNIDGTDLDFGDGSVNGDLVGATIGSGTDTAGNSFTVTEYTVSHTYAASGVYTVFFESCCRVSGLENGSSADFRVEATVDTGPGNNAVPTTDSVAAIQLQSGASRTHFFPALDADGDAISCRFATSSESGLPTGQEVPAVPNGGAQPTLTTVALGCELTWDVTNALAGERYVLHYVVESTHQGVVSSRAVDLIIEIVLPPPPTCVVGTSAGGVGSSSGAVGSWDLTAGSTFSVNVEGFNGVLSDVTALNMTAFGLPSGAATTPVSGTSAAAPMTTSLSWTPTATDEGSSHVVIINYRDIVNISGSCSLILNVLTCPGRGQACTVGVGQCAASGQIECQGVTPVCNATPGASQIETCDGLDNDCDGSVDETFPQAGQTCTSTEVGVCQAGTSMCNAGMVECVSNIAPNTQPEICDGLDNDCDGGIDETFPESGQTCASAEAGICGPGTRVCSNGALLCMPNIAPGSQAEVCDGLDNDCDGSIDETFPESGQTCTSAEVGVCSPGTRTCTGGALSCTPNIAPGSQAEVCDGLDNNCDGQTDETFPEDKQACTSTEVGVCAPGLTFCDAGGLICTPTILPETQTEVCDGLDNNCDGSTDESFPEDGEVCASGGDGLCGPGTRSCDAGALICVPDQPSPDPELCDGTDNNCDGIIDETFPGAGESCDTGLPGVCADGERVCEAGAEACATVVAVGAQDEICDNGIDDDCDGVIDNGCIEPKPPGPGVSYEGSGCTLSDTSQGDHSRSWALMLGAAAVAAIRRRKRGASLVAR